jgi:hypothetical protein
MNDSFEAALTRLADEKATGALYGGAGAVYLANGTVVHADSAQSPDLGVRLIACGRLTEETWRGAVAETGAEHRVGERLVERGWVTRGELELCHLNVMFDAAYFVLLPESKPTRFLPGAAHWLGPVRPVRAGALHREARRRRALLDRVWPWPATDEQPVVPRGTGDRPGRGGRPTPAQRAVLRLADGSRTPVQIAWLLGRSAFTTVLDVRRLAAAGLVATPAASASGAAPASRAAAPVPYRARQPDASVLIRLRDALEARL